MLNTSRTSSIGSTQEENSQEKASRDEKDGDKEEKHKERDSRKMIKVPLGEGVVDFKLVIEIFIN